MSIKSYEDLQVWQVAMDLVVDCYWATDGFPRDERFGITSQLRRAAVQIPANIAEGHARSHHREYLNFLSIAQGSAAELNTHLRIAQRLEFLDAPTARKLCQSLDSIGRMLSALRNALERSAP